ncbi:MAG: diaminopimelate epimerase [Candidatus Omnitrophota bacterium]
MKKINFTKMVASGNDFVVVEGGSQKAGSGNYNKLAIGLCDRKYGVGADGLLLLGSSKIADVRMRIFNSDGSEAEMCGNGSRCAALYAGLRDARKQVTLETKAGLIGSYITGDKVKVNLTEPKGLRLDIPVKINARPVKVNFIDTGVPHAVIFVDGVERIDVPVIGRQVRYHREFLPRGTNVDFIEPLSKDALRIRTYERGVEDETLACGTGSVAAALILGSRLPPVAGSRKIKVHTRGGEVLNVYFDRDKNKFKNVWLEGRVKIVHKGEYYV